jgi:hypothetical protein
MPYLSSRLIFTINNPAHSAQSKLAVLQISIQWVGHTAGHQTLDIRLLMPLTLLRQIK